VIIIEEYTYEEYCESLENKEIIRKKLLNIRMEIMFNKNNPEQLKLLQEQEKNLLKQLRLKSVIIKTYELNIERRNENDKYKGK